jgi:hypothetical protein
MTGAGNLVLLLWMLCSGALTAALTTAAAALPWPQHVMLRHNPISVQAGMTSPAVFLCIGCCSDHCCCRCCFVLAAACLLCRSTR